MARQATLRGPEPASPTASALISTVCGELRLIRTVSQQRRYPGRATPILPSKSAVSDLANQTIAALYPRHFGPPGLHAKETDAFVEAALRAVLDGLTRQIGLELSLDPKSSPETLSTTAVGMAEAFILSLVRIRDLHDTDIAAAYAGDPSAKSLDEIVFCFPGRDAVLRHRLAHQMFTLGAPLLARIMAEIAHSTTAIDIHPGAKLGPAFFVDHGTGVVIGETAVIGRNVRLYQQVTLGAKSFDVAEDGSLVKGLPRHPTIEDNVVIYAGATILGRVTIGQGSIIGGGVWLTKSVPPNSVVTQAKSSFGISD
ncbi:serine O-acetyltransferase EpsC [Pseudotabrizicola sp. 4114]|uniref:serine O-acetyltransferase EpsC n=1 Tax=Pseudotabrizicola sp. 4114 TaxID=2817731 RepID=UPI002860D205|nr:serine O-acetyltransferase [Pseudorhodobacter sp. 4114]